MTEQSTPDVSNDSTTAGGEGTKPRRRRATRPTAPVAVAADETTTPAPDAAETGETAAPPADEAPAPRRRATRSRKATPAPEAEPAVEETPADEIPEEVVVEEAVEPEALPETGSDEPEAVQAPRLATTALLFQAPDLSQVRPRRRRVTATAGSPEEISQATRHEETTAESDEPGAGQVDTGDEAADEQPSRSSRARRRRGGRGRGAAAAEEFAEPVEELAAEPDEAEEPEEGTEPAEGGAEDAAGAPRRRRRRGGRGRRGRGDSATEGGSDEAEPDGEEDEAEEAGDDEPAAEESEGTTSTRRRRRRRRGARSEGVEGPASRRDEVTALRGSTRLEAKRQRRREGRDAGRRRQIITEAEFLARRESVDRVMVVRERNGRTQIAVLEDGVLVEHYVSDQAAASMVGNVYLGRVQNVLPSMEAAFVDVGKGRNAVLYAGEVNWDAAGIEGGQPRRIEQALKSGDSVLVQVTKDPIGHKGARLTSQVTLAGRYLVYVPGGGMTGISRKLPDTERNRLKKILRDVVPDSAGVIVRTAAEGASEEELRADIERLTAQWEAIEKKSKTAGAPALLQGEPDMAIRVVRDIFNDDFSALVVQGDEAWSTISSYVSELAPDLAARVTKWTGNLDLFTVHRVDEQLAKGMDRKVWLPSGGSLVIDRTEAMTVIDVNTGKFTGAGGTLEETVTRNNLEAAEEIVRQLRLRDIGGIIVIDFIDMVLESNRDLVLRRLVECLGRDRTKHQVAEVTSLGLVQMTRKRVGQGLVEAFSETCEHCHGRGFIVHTEPVERTNGRPDAGGGNHAAAPAETGGKRSRRKRAGEATTAAPVAVVPVLPEAREAVKATLATIAAAAAHAHEHDQHEPGDLAEPGAVAAVEESRALDVLAELAAHLPVGDRPVAAPEPDEEALASLAQIAASVAADEGTAGPTAIDEAVAEEAAEAAETGNAVVDKAVAEPGSGTAPEDRADEPDEPEEPDQPEEAAEPEEPEEPAEAPSDEVDGDEGGLGLALVDPTLFDEAEGEPDEGEDDAEQG